MHKATMIAFLSLHQEGCEMGRGGELVHGQIGCACDPHHVSVTASFFVPERADMPDRIMLGYNAVMKLARVGLATVVDDLS